MKILVALLTCIGLVHGSYLSFKRSTIQDDLTLHKYNLSLGEDLPQMASVLTFNYKKYKTFIGYSTTDKLSVPEFVDTNDAIAGINGGFHDFNPNTEYKGGITRLRVDKQDVVSKNSVVENGLQTDNDEGVLGIDEYGKVYIFKNTNQKHIDNLPTFLFSGPLLLLNSKIIEIVNTTWNNVRNPRTAVCISKYKELVKLIVIDGRSEYASGMTIQEFAMFLKTIGCKNAINLDGGGSSLMYVNGLGVINTPMSKTINGSAISVERKISNTILIKRN